MIHYDEDGNPICRMNRATVVIYHQVECRECGKWIPMFQDNWGYCKVREKLTHREEWCERG